MPQLAQLVCDTYADASTGKPTFSCDDPGTAGFDAIRPADLPPIVETGRDGGTTAPLLGERAEVMAHYADDMAGIADIGINDYSHGLREMIQDNPELLRVLPLTDQGI